MNASTTKKKADGAEVAKTSAASRFPQVGDVVLYGHRGGGLMSSQKVIVPMIVTKTYEGSTTIDGVVLSTDSVLMPNGLGAKGVFQVKEGKDEGEWQRRP